MSESVGVNIALGLIKAVVCIYDIVTIPVYYLTQKPWIKRKLDRRPKAVKERPKDPYSSWIRLGQPDRHLVFECNTLSELLKRCVETYGEKKCMGYREVFGEEDERQPDGKVFRKLVMGDYIWFTYRDIDKRIENIAKGLLANGVKPGDTVMILAETKLEWFLTAHAIFRLGGSISTLYATLGNEALVHGINETEVTHMVTTYDLLPKLQPLLSLTSNLKTVIYIEGHSKPKTEGFEVKLISLAEVERNGASVREAKFGAPDPKDTAVIMYTSGSTGVPKGVIITHENVLSTMRGFYAVAGSLEQRHVYIAFLPLAHVLELTSETFFMSMGISIGYSSPHTMTDMSTAIKRGNQGDAGLLQPTVMAAVPLVLDRIRKAIVEKVENRGKLFKGLFMFAMDYKKYWMKRGFDTPVVNALICRKIQQLLGGKLEYVVTGSAPLSPETHDFIRSCLNVVVVQGYGLTETAAGATLMDFDDLSIGRVGPPLYGLRIKLADWKEGNYYVTDKPYPRGEIVIGGSSVTAGYFKNDQLTQEAYREEDGTRWFYTGDVGEIQEDGSIKIIDRKKDLVKLQFGEYISLGKVETELKSCPYVDNICIYGDSYRSYLIALVVPNAKALQALADEMGKGHLSMTDLCRDPRINDAILTAIQDFGRQAKLSKMEIPSKIKLCAEEWSPDSGLVTAALKLRRKNIQDYYKRDINSMYAIENEMNGHSKST